MLKIGITERGDAGIDTSWEEKIRNGSVDGAILITKCITSNFIEKTMDLYRNSYKMIIHCTCTGWGGTPMEPNVPNYKKQIDQLVKLIKRGYPMERCVLRIDPIFPTEKGMNAVQNVIIYACESGLKDIRIRISIFDEYRHVKDRFKERGWPNIYGSAFQATDKQLNMVIERLAENDIRFECCAEDRLFARTRNIGRYPYLFIEAGCVSQKDLDILNIPYTDDMTINMQNRSGCTCLSCKTELLTNKKQCPNGCVYCYWRN